MRAAGVLIVVSLLVAGVALPGQANHTEPVTGLRSIDMIFGGSLKHAETRVLLIPPTHGDLGNPVNGPTALDYLETTLAAIHAWEEVIDLFIIDYPQYAYLDQLTIEVEVFDGVAPSKVGYDIIVGFAETGGDVFRGIAISGPDTQGPINNMGLGGLVHYANRYILLSLFSNAPRAHQSIPDYPELTDLHTVVMHEFAHTWGLGHTLTWTAAHGSDLMNSPYAYVYGDGNAVGDGGERTPALCASSLDLWGLAYLYRWLPSGNWQSSDGSRNSPLPYHVYCL